MEVLPSFDKRNNQIGSSLYIRYKAKVIGLGRSNDKKYINHKLYDLNCIYNKSDQPFSSEDFIQTWEFLTT